MGPAAELAKIITYIDQQFPVYGRSKPFKINPEIAEKARAIFNRNLTINQATSFASYFAAGASLVGYGWAISRLFTPLSAVAIGSARNRNFKLCCCFSPGKSSSIA